MNWIGYRRKWPWFDFRLHPGILLQELWEITINVSQDGRYHVRGSKQVPYKVRSVIAWVNVLYTTSKCSTDHGTCFLCFKVSNLHNYAKRIFLSNWKQLWKSISGFMLNANSSMQRHRQRRQTRQISMAKYRVIKKDGPNFVWLYSKIGTSDKYDVNCIWLYSQWSL
jgi:hypothetical protein